MIYCDTSLLVAAITPELANARVQSWLAIARSQDLCVSRWVTAEIASALSIKVRRGDLSLEQRAQVLACWDGLLKTNIVSVAFPSRAWALATNYCHRHDINLRAGDALHIAIASLGGHSLATLDQAMASAAVAIGVTVETIPAA